MDKYGFYLEETKSRLDRQFARINSLRQRASGTVGVGITLLALAGLSGGDWPLASLLFGILLLICWLALMFLALGLLHSRRFVGGPTLEQIKARVDEFDDEEMAVWAADAFLESNLKNELVIVEDIKTLDKAFFFLIMEAICVVGIVISNRVDLSAFKL